MGIQVFGNAPYLGHTGYNNHAKNFFNHLNKFIPTRVKNYTYCENIDYLSEEEINILVEQELDGRIVGNPFAQNENDTLVNIVLADTNHELFYRDYSHPMIAYNVWESTRQPVSFFNRLLQYDQFWCPSNWQRDCTIYQGYPSENIKVIHEGVGKLFVPNTNEKVKIQLFNKYNIPKNAFVFMIFGKWEHRKSTMEMVRAWHNTFGDRSDCYLVISADNNFSTDGMETTEERLDHYNLNHPNIRILHFVSRSEYVQWLQHGSCLLTCSRSEGWNLPLMEALACGTPSICSDWGAQLEFANGLAYKVQVREGKHPYQVYMMENTEELGYWGEPDFYNLEYIMNYVYDVYDRAKETALKNSIKLRETFTWENAAKTAAEHIEGLCKNNNYYFNQEAYYNIDFIDGPKVEIIGNSTVPHLVTLIDLNPPTVEYQQEILPNNWVKASKKYYKDWFITIHKGTELIEKHLFDLKRQRVLISFDSKSLGDTIAWVPQVEEFRLKHQCHVFLSTFWNHLFKSSYEGIEFIEPGDVIHDIYASYSIGCYDGSTTKNKFDWRTVPLQKVCSDILGLEYEERICKLGVDIGPRPIDHKYVTISEFSTFQGKHWNYPEGWQIICDHLNLIGYEVMSISKEKSNLKHISHQNGKSINETITNIYHSDFFIGVSSGPSWISWALEKPTILISGFTKEWVEFQNKCQRVINKYVCHGCYNDLNFKLDRGDWEWCPTNSNYICTKSIGPMQVIEAIDKIIQTKGLLS